MAVTIERLLEIVNHALGVVQTAETTTKKGTVWNSPAFPPIEFVAMMSTP